MWCYSYFNCYFVFFEIWRWNQWSIPASHLLRRKTSHRDTFVHHMVSVHLLGILCRWIGFGKWLQYDAPNGKPNSSLSLSIRYGFVKFETKQNGNCFRLSKIAIDWLNILTDISFNFFFSFSSTPWKAYTPLVMCIEILIRIIWPLDVTGKYLNSIFHSNCHLPQNCICMVIVICLGFRLSQ